MTAERMGMEAALLGRQRHDGNVTCVLTHCARGEEAILGDGSHIFLNEAGGMSALGGIFPHTISNQPDGRYAWMRSRPPFAVRTSTSPGPASSVWKIRTTAATGAALTPEYTAAAVSLAKSRGLSVHLDGARIFNAAVALGVDVRELTRGVDSVNVCLSKGLQHPSAP